MKENKKPQRKQIKLKEFEVVLLSENASVPKKSVRGSIGYDLCVPKDVKVPAHSRIAIPLDIAINLPFGVEAKIEPRSGHSMRGMEGFGSKTEVVRRILGIFPVKKIRSGRLRFDADVLVGKVDPNYTDNIHVIIKNNDDEFVIRAGSRIAQMTFYQTTSPFFKIVDKLTCKSRGGGLGHTGTGRLRGTGSAETISAPSVESEESVTSTPTPATSVQEDNDLVPIDTDTPTSEHATHDENDTYGVHV